MIPRLDNSEKFTQPMVNVLIIIVQKGSATEPGLPARELRGPDGQHALQRRREVRPRTHVPPLALDRASPGKLVLEMTRPR